MDIDPIKLGLTWSNNREGSEGVSKCLDRFMVRNSLISKIEIF